VGEETGSWYRICQSEGGILDGVEESKAVEDQVLYYYIIILL